MKLVPEGKLKYGRIESDGKILEITPLLYMADNSITALPPTAYQCPNWLLGYEDYHSQGMPYTLMPYNREAIPGSATAYPVQLGFMIRIYENSPGMVPNTLPTIPAEWAETFAKAVAKAVKNGK